MEPEIPERPFQEIADGGFETLAGFLLYRLGAIPRPGDAIEYDGRRYTVLEMDRNRIARVRIEKIPAAEAQAAESPTTPEQPPHQTG